MKYTALILLLALASCNWAKEKTKSAINKTGEVVGKTGSEFTQGVVKGVEKTFQNEVIISDALKKAGIATGKIIITGTDSTRDNIITAYIIFNENFNQPVTVKVTGEDKLEYGRVTDTVKANKGEARYVDFVFDKRTNIDSKGTLTFE